MDYDSFLASPRWEILKIIAEKPSSPVEIAKELNTTVSYVSQQLKLLDAAGLVIKKRTGASQRGKPRMLFSISEDLAYITILSKNFTNKKKLNLLQHHKIILNIWMLKKSDFHYYIEKFFWKIEEELESIKKIIINENDILAKIILVIDNKKTRTKIQGISKKKKKKLEFEIISSNQLKKLSMQGLSVIYSQGNLNKEMKGGELDKHG